MFQTADDLIIYIGWVFHNVVLILQQIFLPVRYIFAFLNSAISSAFASPVTPSLPFTFNSGLMSMFQTIPYFSNLIAGIGVAFGIMALVGLFKIIQRV